jgi:hypothetical protein
MGRRAQGRGAADGTGLAVVPKAALRKRKTSDSPQGIIASICKRLVGGKQTFMELARFAPEIDPECQPIIEEWDRLAGNKRVINLDAICKVRQIDPFHFLGVVAEAAVKYRDNASVIIAALSLPNVVERSVKTALTKDGFKDREALMKHAGFLPVPSGNVFVNKVAGVVQTARDEQPEGAALPSFEKTIDIEADV